MTQLRKLVSFNNPPDETAIMLVYLANEAPKAYRYSLSCEMSHHDEQTTGHYIHER